MEKRLTYSTSASAKAQDESPSPRSAQDPSESPLRTLIENCLDDERAEDVISISLAGKSALADYMIVASGRSARQVSAIAEKLAESLKSAGYDSPKIEGKEQADWVLIDTGDVIVHIFRPEVREFYQIEKLWQTEILQNS